jgi:hypothetical protein
MNTWIMRSWTGIGCTLLLTGLSAAACFAADAPLGALRLPNFDAIAGKAVKTVDISLDTSLLGLAAGFMDSSKPDDAEVKELISSLKGIYVRSYTFEQDFVYPEADVDALRRQLLEPGWQRLVAVHDSPHHSNVDIYISVGRGRANGLAIIASQPREFTIVNIVGAIDLKKLHQLQGKFGIPQMPLPDK